MLCRLLCQCCSRWSQGHYVPTTNGTAKYRRVSKDCAPPLPFSIPYFASISSKRADPATSVSVGYGWGPRPCISPLYYSWDPHHSRLAVISSKTSSLLGYLDIEKIKKVLIEESITEADQVSKVMNELVHEERGGIFSHYTRYTVGNAGWFRGREFAIVTTRSWDSY